MSEVAVISTAGAFGIPPVISVPVAVIIGLVGIWKYNTPHPKTLWDMIMTKNALMALLAIGVIIFTAPIFLRCKWLNRIIQSRMRTEDIPDESSTTNQYGQSSYTNSGNNSESNRQKRIKFKDEQTQKISDEESSENEENPEINPIGNKSETKYQIKTISTHIVNRLDRFVRLGGMVQRISKMTDIATDEVLDYGASFSQARSSTLQDHHAAHIVRIKSINTKIKEKYNILFREISNFGGHVQIVEKWANVWHGIGGEIDRLQERFYAELLKINFSIGLTEEALEILQKLKNEFITALEKVLNGDKLNSEQRFEIEKSIKIIRDYSIEELFGKGRDGYSNIHTEYVPEE